MGAIDTEFIVGIDLGTTNSSIALYKNDTCELVKIDGERMIPSCVGLDDKNQIIVGQKAKNQLALRPQNTVASVKRLMGEDTTVDLGGKKYSPEEISAFILKELKRQADAYFKIRVTRAVITVPAFFTERQRQATRKAGELAGLEVVRIINEPTAAALVYESGQADKQRVLVYDLGGGTFDASLVDVENGIVEVRSSHGDTHLGGDDFDRLLMDHIANDFKSKHGIDLREDPKASNRLWLAVERAKRTLSNRPYAAVREELISDGKNLDIELSRDMFEEMLRPWLRKTIEAVHACLSDAFCLPKAIDKIVLAGGSTRIPLIYSLLQSEIGVEPRHEINPDLIVAMGAAIQGAACAGSHTRSILVDITPYTFGTSVVGLKDGIPIDDLFVPVIRRGTPLPAAKEEVFYTMCDNQESIHVEIFQGDAEIASDNILIGDFMVNGLSKVPEGSPVLLNLALDLNGMLKVTAKEKCSGLMKTVTMDIKKAGAHSGSHRESRIVAPVIDGEAEPIREESNAEDGRKAVARAKALRQRAEKLLPGLNEEDSGEMRTLLDNSRRAVSSGDWDELIEINTSLDDMLFYLED